MRLTILIFAAVLSFASLSAHADIFAWQEIADQERDQGINSSGVKTFQLDAVVFQQAARLAQRQVSNQPFEMNLPLPSGEVMPFYAEPYTFEESPGDDFQAWRVSSTTTPAITGAVDYSSIGFHATLFMPDGDIAIIDPQELLGQNQRYNVKLRSATHKDKDFSCTVHDHSESLVSKVEAEVAQRAARGLKTYRLAMAATSRYTTYFDGVDNALNAIRAMVNRVNAIYERDLEVQLILVSGTNLVFSSDNTPFVENVDTTSLAEQNTPIIDGIIGSGGYDIGHVVSQGGLGGIAALASVCNANAKGYGATSRDNPIGDAFNIDFVAHEIGHQFGATHTFNSETGSCGGGNREAGTAYEPGSGSTIMAYAGICPPNDLQANSDALFHIGSIEQIDAFIGDPARGGSCGNFVGTTNSAPDIDLSALTQNLIVKAGEEFTLTGAATDVDGDTLSYNWDQFDAGTATDVNVDAGDNALFRSTLPSASPTRTFPGLTTKNRNLTFKFVVRDGRGGVSSATTIVKVIDGEEADTPPSSSGGGGAMFKLLILFGILWGIGVIRKNDDKIMVK